MTSFLLSWLFGICEHYEVDEYALLRDMHTRGYKGTDPSPRVTYAWWRPAMKVSLAA